MMAPTDGQVVLVSLTSVKQGIGISWEEGKAEKSVFGKVQNDLSGQRFVQTPQVCLPMHQGDW